MLHNNELDDPTETSPLIKKESRSLPTRLGETITYTTPIVVQIVLGTVGLGAGFLYAGPAGTCAKSPTCGLWLSNLTNPKVAEGIFFSGGLDYAGINAYFSSRSVQDFFLFITKQPSWFTKLTWGTVIVVYTGGQSISSFLSSTSTNAKPWQTVLTVAGALPGNLFTAVNNAQYEIPRLIAFMKEQYRFLHNVIPDLCITPSAEEKIAKQEQTYNAGKHAEFLQSVDNHWSYLKSHPRDRCALPIDTPLSYLFLSPAAERQNGYLRNAVKTTTQVVALGMSSTISVPFALNNFATLTPYVHNKVGSAILTTYFSYTFVYSNFKLCHHFLNGVLQILDRIITGSPIDSLVFQLHPYITMGAIALILVAAAMSFALMNVVYEMVFPERGPTRDTFRYLGDASMILYHIAGLYHFYELLTAKVSFNQQDQFMFKVEAEVERLHKMTVDDFVAFMKGNPDNINRLLGIQPFQHTVHGSHDLETGKYQRLDSAPTLLQASQTARNADAESTNGTAAASPMLK